jgi:hypothetical protein
VGDDPQQRLVAACEYGSGRTFTKHGHRS